MSRISWVSLAGAAALGAALLVSPSASHAVVLETEPFNYPGNLGGSLNGLTGGTGWGANAWADTDTDATLATTNTSLSYPPGVPITATGSRLELAATDTAAGAERTLGTGMNLATGGQTFYSSELFRRSAATGEMSTVNFFSDVNIRWFYGIDDNGNFSVAVNPGLIAQRATSADVAAADTTYLLVARIRTNSGTGGNDEVFLEVYDPTETVVEPANDAAWDLAANGGSSVTLSGVRLNFVNAAGQTNQFDELRVGTTFLDVTGVPEPGGVALAALAAPALLRRCRRRRA